jgi:hypothetical protein
VHTTVAVMGGGEFAVVASRHLEIVPHFRLLGVRRGSVLNDSGTTFATLGLKAMLFRGGVDFASCCSLIYTYRSESGAEDSNPDLLVRSATVRRTSSGRT